MDVGLYLVEFLKKVGIKHFLGVPGVHNLGVFDHLSDVSAIANERSCGYMASGIFAASSELSCAMLIGGPGITHAIGGLEFAAKCSVPLVVLCVEKDSNKDHRHQIHNVSNELILSSLGPTLRLARVEDFSALPSFLSRLYGVSSIIVPTDLIRRKLLMLSMPAGVFDMQTKSLDIPRSAIPQAVEKFVKRISGKRGLVFCDVEGCDVFATGLAIGASRVAPAVAVTTFEKFLPYISEILVSSPSQLFLVVGCSETQKTKMRSILNASKTNFDVILSPDQEALSEKGTCFYHLFDHEIDRQTEETTEDTEEEHLVKRAGFGSVFIKNGFSDQSLGFTVDGCSRMAKDPCALIIKSTDSLSPLASGIGEAFNDQTPLVVILAGHNSNSNSTGWFPVLAALSATTIYGNDLETLLLAKDLASSRQQVVLYVFSEEKRENISLRSNHLQCDKSKFYACALNLIRSKRPLIYVGKGCTGEGHRIMKLAEVLDGVVFTTISGKGVVPENHPRWCWNSLHPTCPPEFSKMIESTSCTIVLGARLSELAVSHYRAQVSSPVFQVDIDPECGASNLHAKLIVASVSSFLDFMEEFLPDFEKVSETTSTMDEIAKCHSAVNKRLEQQDSRSAAKFISKMQASLPRDAIFFSDSGNGTLFCFENLRLNEPKSFFCPTDYSCMGFSVPAAAGTALMTKKCVVACVGDGAFLMTGIETLGLAKEPFITVVLRDGKLGMMADIQRLTGRPEQCVRLREFSLQNLCQGVDVVYLKASVSDEVESVMKQALVYIASRRKVLVEFFVSYEELSYFSKGIFGGTSLTLREKSNLTEEDLVQENSLRILEQYGKVDFWSLTKRMEKFGSKIAVEGACTLSYIQLSNGCNYLAQRLSEFQVRKGSVVGVLSDNRGEVIALHFAVACLGGIVLNLNTRLSERELQYIASHSNCQLICFSFQYAETATKICNARFSLEHVDWNFQQKLPRTQVPDENDSFQMYYTSGTTGHPKGVRLTYKNVWLHFFGTMEEMKMTSQDKWGHVSPMFHLVDAFAIYCVSYLGATHVFGGSIRPNEVGKFLQTSRITCVNLSSSLAHFLLRDAELSLPDLRIVSFGGAPLPDSVVKGLGLKLGCEIFVSYGMTECCGKISMSLIENQQDPEKWDKVCTSGRPFKLINVKIVNKQNEIISEPGVVGEIVVAGETVFNGYYKNLKATRESFIGGRWFRTGDLGMWTLSRGYLKVADRKKDMILFHGENVYAQEVEAVVSDFPQVFLVAVYGVPDTLAGELVKAVVQLNAGELSFNEAEAVRFCKARLADYKVPQLWEVIEKMPFTGSGKIAKSKLKQMDPLLEHEVVEGFVETWKLMTDKNRETTKQSWIVIADQSQRIGSFVKGVLNVKQYVPAEDVENFLANSSFQPDDYVLSLWQAGSSWNFDMQLKLFIDLAQKVVSGGAKLVFVSEADGSKSSALRAGLRVLFEESRNVFSSICLADFDPDTMSAFCQSILEKGEPEMRFSKGTRYLRRIQRQRLTPYGFSLVLDSDGTFVVTGGLGGLAGFVVTWLVEKGVKRIELWTRSHAQKFENPAARVVQVDVRTFEQVSNRISQIGSNLRGIFHLAFSEESLTASPFMQMKFSKVKEQISSKTDGLENIQRALKSHKVTVKHLVLFSSLLSMWGFGQTGPVAIANGYLDGFVDNTVAEEIVCINWGNFAETGMVHRLGSSFANYWKSLGHELLDPKKIALYLESLIKGHVSRAGIFRVDWQAYSMNPLAPKSKSLDNFISAVQEKKAKAEEVSRAEVDVAVIVSEILGISKEMARSINSFGELGFTSVMGVDLWQRLTKATGKTLPATIMFDCPGVSQLEEFLGLSKRHESSEQFSPVEAMGDLRKVVLAGKACRVAQFWTPDELWESFEAGKDLIQVIPRNRWNWELVFNSDADAARDEGKSVSKWGCFFDGISLFDASFFNISPREAVSMDPQQRMLLECAWESIEDGFVDPSSLRNQKGETDVFVGIQNSEYWQRFHGAQDRGFHATSFALSIAAGRISYFLDVQGHCLAIDTACSSSLVCINSALRRLQNRDSDYALCMGSACMSYPDVSINYSVAGMLSPTGRCKTFDASADGYVRGEGCGSIFLTSDFGTISGVPEISACDVNQDGRSSGITAPNGMAQVNLIRRTLKRAKIETEMVNLIEAHGTGTALGDPIETNGIYSTYGESRGSPFVLASGKTNHGHLETAAGAIGLLKLALELEKRLVPKVLHFFQLNPYIGQNILESFRSVVPLETVSKDEVNSCASISSFGYSGTNSHAIIRFQKAQERKVANYLRILVSGKTLDDCKVHALKYLSFAQSNSFSDIDWIVSLNARARKEKAVVIWGPRLRDNLKAFASESKLSEKDLVWDEKSQFFIFGSIGEHHYEDNHVVMSKARAGFPRTQFTRSSYWSQSESVSLNSSLGLCIERHDGCTFQIDASSTLLYTLEDHIVYGAYVMPGAVHLCFVATVAQSHFDIGKALLQDIEIQRPVIADPAQKTLLQYNFDKNGDTYTWEVLRPKDKNPYAKGLLRDVKSANDLSENFVIPVVEGKVRLEGVQVWGNADSAKGVVWGPSFRWIESCEVDVDIGVALCVLMQPKGFTSRLGIYPEMIDSMFQSCNCFERARNAQLKFYAPFTIESFSIHVENMTEKEWKIGVRELQVPSSTMRSDISLMGKDNQVVAHMQKFTMVQASSEVFSVSKRAEAPKWIFEISWERSPSIAQSSLQQPHQSCILISRGKSKLQKRIFQNIRQIVPHVEERILGQKSQLKQSTVAGAEVVINTFGLARTSQGLKDMFNLLRICPDLQHIVVLSQASVVKARDCGKTNPWSGAVRSFVNSIGVEKRGDATITIVDIDNESLEKLGAEVLLFSAGETREVALRGGERYIPEMRHVKTWADGDLGYSLNFADGVKVGPPPQRDSLQPGEVRVDIMASSLNFRDVLQVYHLWPEDPEPIGFEMSGVISESQSSKYVIGDRVFGLAYWTFCSSRKTHETHIVKIPPCLSFDDAAATTVVFCTVLANMKFGKISETSSILVHAAAGGIGLAALQLGRKTFNVKRVFGTAGAQAKQKLALSWGCDFVCNSRNTLYCEEILERTGGCGVDFVINSLSGGNFVERTVACLSENGVFIELGIRGIWNKEQFLEARPQGTFRIYQLAMDRDAGTVPDLLTELCSEFSSGKIKPLPTDRFPLRHAAEAFQFMFEARHIGKVVLIHPPVTHFGPGECLFVSGGFGGLGLVYAQKYMQETRCSDAIISSRAGCPGSLSKDFENIRLAMTRLEVGISEDTIAHFCFVGCAVKVTQVVSLHLAGTLSDAMLENMEWRSFRDVFKPKVSGFRSIHKALCGERRGKAVIFSSVTSMIGFPAQGNYAAANGFLDALSLREENTFSIAWGPWGDVGMYARLRGEQQQQKDSLLRPKNAWVYLTKALESGSSAIGVVDVDWDKFPRGFLARKLGQKAAVVVEIDDPEAFVSDCVKMVLGLDMDFDVPMETPLRDLGLDSMTSVELRQVISGGLQIELPLTMAFDYPTVAAIVKLVREKVDFSSIEKKDGSAEVVVSEIGNFAGKVSSGTKVIGASFRFGRSSNMKEFNEIILNGKDQIVDTSSRWSEVLKVDRTSHRAELMWAGLLPHVDSFDADFFQISRREATVMNPEHRLLLTCSWEALESASIAPLNTEKQFRRVDVFVGMGKPEYYNLLVSRNISDPFVETGNYPSAAAGRISYFFGLNGPCSAIDTACSSSLVALTLSRKSLDEDCASLCCGVNALATHHVSLNLAMAGMLSAAGRCKTLDASVDGFVRAEGCAVILMAQKAEMSGLCEVLVSEVNEDGRSNGLTAPSSVAQQQLITLCQKNLGHKKVNFFELHGTGTSLGDPIEVQGLAGSLQQSMSPYVLSAVKTIFGHTETASGLLSMMKFLASKEVGEMSHNLHFQNLNPLIGNSIIERSKMLIPLENIGLDYNVSYITGISAFGFSGVNSHVVLSYAQYFSFEKNRDIIDCLSVVSRTREGLKMTARRCLDLTVEHNEKFILGVCQVSKKLAPAMPCRVYLDHRFSKTLAEHLRLFLEPRKSTEIRNVFDKSSVTRERTVGGFCSKDVGKGSEDFKFLLRSVRAKFSVEKKLNNYEKAILWGYFVLKETEKLGVKLQQVTGMSRSASCAAAVADIISLDDALRVKEPFPKTQGKFFSILSDGRDDLSCLNKFDVDVIIITGRDNLSRILRPHSSSLERGTSASNLKAFQRAAKSSGRLSNSSLQVRRLSIQERRTFIKAAPPQRGNRLWLSWYSLLGNVMGVSAPHAVVSDLPHTCICAFKEEKFWIGSEEYQEEEFIEEKNTIESDKVLSVEGIVRNILRLSESEAIDINLPVRELGMDSLLDQELARELSRYSGLNIDATFPYTYPSVRAMQDFFENKIERSKEKIQFEMQVKKRVGIVGAGCRVSTAKDLLQFFKLLVSDQDLIQPVPKSRYDMDNAVTGLQPSRWGSFIANVFSFDHKFFGISKREASSMDPQQKLSLICSFEAFESDTRNCNLQNSKNAGVYVGANESEYHLSGGVANNHFALTGRNMAILSGRISYFLGMNGPSMVINCACSSSLVALSFASRDIEEGKVEHALAGGVQIIFSAIISVQLIENMMLSPSGRCKTFDSSADGYVRSEGCVFLKLSEQSDEVEIMSHFVNQDGARNGLTAPNGSMQQLVIEHAHRLALEKGASSFDLYELHGTGTALGDPIEVKSLAKSCNTRSSKLIHSVKANMGHSEACAGVLGILTVILFGMSKVILNSMHFKDLNPMIGSDVLESKKFTIPLEQTHWDSKNRCAGVSSFGFSGTNCHVVLRLGSEKGESVEHEIRISAKTETALRRRCADIAICIIQKVYPQAPFISAFACKYIVGFSSKKDAVKKLQGYTSGEIGNASISYPFQETKIYERTDHKLVVNPTKSLDKTIDQKKESIEDVVRDILGLSATDELEKDSSFRDLGVDSVLGIALVEKLGDFLQVKLSQTILFEFPTLRELFSGLSNLQAEKKSSKQIVVSEMKNLTKSVYILSFSCRLGSCKSPSHLFQELEHSKDFVSTVPMERWMWQSLPESVSKWGVFVQDIFDFDAAFFSISEREAREMDPQQRALLETAWEAVEEGVGKPKVLSDATTGVYVGIADSEYYMSSSSTDHFAGTGYHTSVASGRISYFMGLSGSCVSLNTACSSSLFAISFAHKSISRGKEAFALAFGVNAMFYSRSFIILGNNRMLSPDGRCKSFDNSANGYVRAEGCAGALLSEKFEENAYAYAEILSCETNQDGFRNGLTAPSVSSQRKLLESTILHSCLESPEISFFETHGTGTSLGDPIEAEALMSVVGSVTRESPLALRSSKTNFGHAETAAGIFGLLTITYAMVEKAFPSHLHLKNINSFIGKEKLEGSKSLFSNESISIPSRGKIFGLSSFGISGSNAQALCRSDISNIKNADTPQKILCLASAKSGNSLHAFKEKLSLWLVQNYGVNSLVEALSKRTKFVFSILLEGAKKEVVNHLGSLGFADSSSSGQVPSYSFERTRFSLAQKNVLGGNYSKPEIDVSRSLPTQSSSSSSSVAAQVKSCIERVVGTSAFSISAGFDELGFDSILSIQLGEELAKNFNIPVSPTWTFDFPTVQKLINHFSGEIKSTKTSLSRLRVSGSEIFVLGYAGCFGSTYDARELWSILDNEVDAIRVVPENRFDWREMYSEVLGVDNKSVSKWGFFCDGVFLFDNRLFNISMRESLTLDPQQRMLLQTSWAVFESSKIDPMKVAEFDVCVFVGMMTGDYSNLLNFHVSSPYVATGITASPASGRISYFFGLTGSSCCIDTACSSSLVALDFCAKETQLTESGMGMCFGVNALCDSFAFVAASQGGMMSPTGRCKSFDNSADGYVRGEGCGGVLLSLENKDKSSARLQGHGVNQDGRSNGLTAPNGMSQLALLEKVSDQAKERSGETFIQVHETHTTGTALGDPIEVDAIYRWKRNEIGRSLSVLTTSKVNVGHLEAAAGICGLLKLLQVMENKLVPKHLNFSQLNHHISVDKFFQIRSLLAIERISLKDCRNTTCSQSSFGMSGTNAFIILQSLSQIANDVKGCCSLICVGGRTEDETKRLQIQMEKWIIFSEGRPAPHFDVSITPFINKEYLIYSGLTRKQLQKPLKVLGGESRIMNLCFLAAVKWKCKTSTRQDMTLAWQCKTELQRFDNQHKPWVRGGLSTRHCGRVSSRILLSVMKTLGILFEKILLVEDFGGFIHEEHDPKIETFNVNSRYDFVFVSNGRIEMRNTKCCSGSRRGVRVAEGVEILGISMLNHVKASYTHLPFCFNMNYVKINRKSSAIQKDPHYLRVSNISSPLNFDFDIVLKKRENFHLEDSPIVHVGMFCEMILNAVSHLFPKEVELSIPSVKFLRGVFVSEEGTHMFLRASEGTKTGFSVQVYAQSNGEWFCCAEATVEKAETKLSHFSPSSQEPAEVISKEEFYKFLKEKGIFLGPSLQCVSKILKGSDFCFADIDVVDRSTVWESDQLPFHVAVMDACAQIFHVFLRDNKKVVLASEISGFMFFRTKSCTKSVKAVFVLKDENIAKIQVFSKENICLATFLCKVMILSGGGRGAADLDKVDFTSKTPDEAKKLIMDSFRKLFSAELCVETLADDEELGSVGLDSVVGMLAVSRAREFLGLDIKIEDLQSTSTLLKLSAIVYERSKNGKSRQIEESEASAVSFERISKSTSDSVLFCFPFGGGSAKVFRKWEDLLIDVDIYALNLADNVTELRLGDLAEKVSCRILEIAGTRQISLYGHSSGALLAFCSARVLEAKGIHVHLLAVGAFSSPFLKTNRILDEFLKVADVSSVLQLMKESDEKKWVEWFKGAEKFIPGVVEVVMNKEISFDIRRNAVKKILWNLSLVEDYTKLHAAEAKKLSCDVLAFAGQDDEGVPVADINLWQNTTTNSFEVIILESATHLFIEDMHHLSTLTSKLKKFI